MSPSEDDRPWTEAQWEDFLRKSEARSARYCELFETLIDHPDAEAIIAREMGWTDDDDDEEFNAECAFDVNDAFAGDDEWEDSSAGRSLPDEFAAGHEFADDEDDIADEAVAGEGADDDGDDEDPFDGDRKMRAIPAYAAAYDWGLRVHQSLRDLVNASECDDPTEPLMVAYGDSLLVAAKIAGGQGLNSDGSDESLCGNIVLCRIALDAANRSLAAMAELRGQEIGEPAMLDSLIEEGNGVRRVVEARIAELRSRVWWE
jgi:hypothetical protein